MEKIPAACVMEWSIQLEKGLRSKNLGKSIEEILKFGRRLEWWNRESKISVAEYKIFGLIPGEDKLFANAILLRLADAFRMGDKQIKTCIVKMFLEELKSRSKKRGRTSCKMGEDGILSKKKLDNYLEILRRVKIVFDDGDVEERALSLYLFGCWADFARDSADIRYVVLSSSVSDNILEVKASLFAAGCFCELAADFASVLLEMLASRLKSSETSVALKLAGAQAFAKMWCSFSLANRAYKTGLELVQGSSDKTFSLVMLISLTKIASTWTLLIPQQMELLSSFLAKDRIVHVQITTLKCIQFLLARGVCPTSAARDMIQKLINIPTESKIPPALLGEALKVLHKILSYSLPTFPSSEMIEVIPMLLKFIESIIQSSFMQEICLAIWVLVDILGKFLGRVKLEFDETASILAHQLIAFVMDQIFVLVKSKVDKHVPMDREVTSLLRLLLNLVENHSDISCLVLDKVNVFMEHLVSIIDKDVDTEKEDILNHETSKPLEEEHKPVFLKVVVFLAKITNACLENLKVDNAVTVKVLNSLKLMVDYLRMSASFDLYTYGIYLLLLHLHCAYRCTWQESNQILDLDGNYTLYCGPSFFQNDTLSVECAKKMFERRDYWSSYKAGKHAACHGSWSTAAVTFEKLKKMVLSDSNYLWLKSLALFSHSESQIEPFGLFTVKDGSFRAEEGITFQINLRKYAEILVRSCNGLRLSETTLGSSVPRLAFNFQRWFLVLRRKVLDILVNLTTLLGAASFLQDSSTSGKNEATVLLPSLVILQRFSLLVQSLTQISYQLKKVANEYDLLAMSSVGSDRKSVRRISTLAASCSLLAFSTGLALSIPYSHTSEKNGNCSLDSSEEQFHVNVIQDLLERLWPIDSETSKDLGMLLKVYRKSTSCSLPQSRNQVMGICYIASDVVKLCRFAVIEIVGLQNKASRLSSDESIYGICNDGLQLLLRIIFKWMQLPFRCPNHFFRVRNCVSSELFAMNEDGANVDGTSLLLGSHLSLNLCLQLKNMPPYLPVRLCKLYCILSFTIQPPNGGNEEQSRLKSENWEMDDILDLNEKLIRYVTSSATSNGIHTGSHTDNCWAKDNYVYFHLNDRVQGFSTCLLDISAFPVGTYRIQWHSCCIDNEGSYWSLLPLNPGPSFTVLPSASGSMLASLMEVP